MRTFKKVLLVLGLVSSAASGGTLRAQPTLRQPRAVPGELIVKFKPAATPGERGRARAAAAGRMVAELARTPDARAHGPLELVRVPAAALQAAIATLRRDPAVEYAEPNWIYTHQAAPNDPRFPQQWALENTGQSIAGVRGVGDADIDALAAWAAGPAGSTVYIGVIDEGIDFNHPDLGAQPGGVIWTNPFDPIDGVDNDHNGYVDDRHGWDFFNGDNSVYDGSAADPLLDSHGTHVAGTIAARTGNGLGVAGVSPGTVIIPAKFLGIDGGTTAGAVRARTSCSLPPLGTRRMERPRTTTTPSPCTPATTTRPRSPATTR